MKGATALFSRKSDEWATPPDIYERIAIEFGPFTLDPCATPENAKCARYFTSAENGLAQDWSGERVFLNPPFSGVGKWIAKARTSGAYVVCLVAARTGSAWWHEHVEGVATVRFLRGRIKFGGAPYNAPFDCAIVVYEPMVSEEAA